MLHVSCTLSLSQPKGAPILATLLCGGAGAGGVVCTIYRYGGEGILERGRDRPRLISSPLSPFRGPFPLFPVCRLLNPYPLYSTRTSPLPAPPLERNAQSVRPAKCEPWGGCRAPCTMHSSRT
eukprot:scaffold5918_cov124-Isochrysis_galbana.AAC.6